MTKVNVLAGGASAEREVSLRSGNAVANALRQAGFEVHQFNPANSAIDDFIDCDVVFPVLHGTGGEDGTIQVELERRGVKFVGSGSDASRLCFDKWRWLIEMEASDIKTPAGELVNTENFTSSKFLSSPFVIKPFDGGSSIDTFIVRDPSDFDKTKTEKALEAHDSMLIQELVFGTEITVGVLGDKALPIIKITPPESGEFDYENKYNGKSQEAVSPRDIDPKLQREAQVLAEKIHKICGCRHLSRTDMIIKPSGDIVVLETNTMPGMTEQSLYPKMAAPAGLSMPDLCQKLVEMALNS